MPATEQTVRSQPLLHKIFAIGSLVLLVATLWMFAKDNDRQWKDYQRKFRQIEVTNSQWDEVRVKAELNEDQLNELKHDLLAEQSTPPNREVVDKFIAEVARGYQQQHQRDTGEESGPALQAKIDGMKTEINAAYTAIEEPPVEGWEGDTPTKKEEAELAWRFENKKRRDELLEDMGDILARATFLENNLLDIRKMKAAEYDAAKSILDLAVRDGLPTIEAQEKVAVVEAELNELTLHYQQASDHRKQLGSIIDEVTADQRKIDKKIADNRAEMETITTGIEKRQAHWIEGYWVGKKLLESPIVDAFGSPLKIENLWTDGLTHNYYNFKPVLRYDRCTTCHQAMEKTQAGTATDPLYQPIHTLTFALETPSAEALAESKTVAEVKEGEEIEAVPDTSPAALLASRYGIKLAAEGVLDRDDVTINYVRFQSPAAKALLGDDDEGVRYLSAELIESSVSAPFEADGDQRPQFGLMVGDVIVSIGGDKVLSNDEVQRKLLETVKAGEPISITVRRGYPNPFVTHPRLDLFVGSTSPHKLQVMGCTVCHEGQGSATDFKWSSHTPDTLKQRDEWRKEYGWFNNHHWIMPMPAARFAESSCLKCHHDVVDLEPSERFPEPPAPKLMAGYNTVRRYGCFGCHEVVGYNGPDKRIGPDLRLEPNYFAAGLQLAHISDQYAPVMEEKLPELKATLAARQKEAAVVQADVDEAQAAVTEAEAEVEKVKAEEAPVEAAEAALAEATANLESAQKKLEPFVTKVTVAEAELNVYQANLVTLREASERGRLLAEAPDNDENRHRLKELLDDDQDERNRAESAQAAGEVTEEVYVPAFPSEAYDTAMVLKDDEIPGQFRKVGPALRYVDAKLDQAFLDDWIHEPDHFRPSTRMPQFFGLTDHMESTLSDPEKRAEATKKMRHHTEELEDIEVQGIRTYLQYYSQAFDPIAGGDEAIAAAKAERGKVMFEIGGCLACHSNDDFPDHGDQGPNLTGLGSKLVGEEGRLWLYGWIQNPKRYHARTKMPVVTLKPLPGDEETDPIADVVEYLLADKSDWTSRYAEDKIDTERLDELALMHLEKAYSKSFADDYLESGIPESRRSALKGAEVELLMADELVTAREVLSQEKKLLYIGSKSIAKYGCYACHDIPGFEGAKPIGTALSDWGRKDPSKLAFEHINHYVGHGHGGGHGGGHAEAHSEEHGDHDHDEGQGHDHDGDEHAEAEHDGHDDSDRGDGTTEGDEAHADPADLAYYEHELHHGSRVGFIHQKLKEPRSFDYAKLDNKAYNDRLRMPLFPLEHEQHEQVITFVLGLVADPPAQQFVNQPSPRQTAINEGRKVLDKFHCAGCHELQREEWDVTYPENWDRLSRPAPPNTYPFLIPHITQAEINTSTDVNRSGRLQATLSGRVKRQSNGELDIYAYDPLDEDYLPLGELEEDQYAADALAYNFELYDPTLISGELYMPKESLPVIPMKMIQKRHARWGGDLAYYLLPRVLKYTTSANSTKGEEAWGWLPPTLVGQGNKTQPAWLHSFLLDPHPIRPAAMLNMPKFNMSADDATKLVNYFAAVDSAEYPYQFDERQQRGHLAEAASRYQQAHEQLSADEQAKFSGNRFDDILQIVTSQSGCVKCHSIGDYVMKGDPRAMGPNLSEVHARLQPEYARRWIAQPSYILPYTAMPNLITYNPADPSKDGFPVKVYHGTSTEQLDALVDLLMNLDAYGVEKSSIASLVKKPPTEEAAPEDGADDAAPTTDEPPQEDTTTEESP